MTKKTQQKSIAVRHGKLKRSSSLKNILKTVLTTLLVLVISGTAVTAYALWDLANNVQTVSLGKPVDGTFYGIDSEPIEGAFAIALIGSDTRADQVGYNDGIEGELNDVNLLLYVDETHTNATVISFSRDLMLPIPACPGPNGEEFYSWAESEAQLNTALFKGGLVCAVRTLEEFTGIEIDYAGLITFDGVINMSNAIGGVEVCLTEPIFDQNTGLDLPAGDITLVGNDALQFLRTRYGVGDGGDASRISNQQIFMASMVRQLQETATFSDPAKVYRLAKAAVENITLSESLVSIPVMQSMAVVLKDLDLERINFVQFPIIGHPYAQYRYAPDWPAAEELLYLVKSGQAFEVESLGTAAIEAGAGDDLGNDVVIDDETVIVDEVPLEEGTETSEIEEGPVKVNPNVTGQSAAKVTCSQGRTVWG